MHPRLEFAVTEDDVTGKSSPSPSSFKKPTVAKTNKEMTADNNHDIETSRNNCKQIRFGKRVKVKKIRSYKIFSDDEYHAVWYTEEEYTEIKKGCVRTLRQMMNADFREDENFCPRGLEVRTKDASSARKEVRGMATQMVIEEQHLQTEWGVKNEERIRKCYQEVSQEAHKLAHYRALTDAKVAKEYLRRR